jgi:hypothetical protein
MDKTEAAEATAAIGMMLKAFPSSQSTMSADSPKVYLFAVEDFSLDAIKRACRMFVRGEVKGRNNAFAPSAPELSDACKTAEGALKVEHYEADRLFVEAGSALWKQLQIHRGDHSLPTFQRDGKDGWFFTKEDCEKAAMIALPPNISEQQMAINATRAKGLIGQVTTFNSADDDKYDMGGERVA